MPFVRYGVESTRAARRSASAAAPGWPMRRRLARHDRIVGAGSGLAGRRGGRGPIRAAIVGRGRACGGQRRHRDGWRTGWRASLTLWRSRGRPCSPSARQLDTLWKDRPSPTCSCATVACRAPPAGAPPPPWRGAASGGSVAMLMYSCCCLTRSGRGRAASSTRRRSRRSRATVAARRGLELAELALEPLVGRTRNRPTRRLGVARWPGTLALLAGHERSVAVKTCSSRIAVALGVVVGHRRVARARARGSRRRA